MKIKHWDLIVTWDDGSTHEVSSYVPMGLVREVEDFIDYWEEKHGEDGDEAEAQDIDDASWRA